jgi:hypothetical protein
MHNLASNGSDLQSGRLGITHKGGKKTKDARKGRGIASTVLYSDRVYSYYFNDVLGIVGSTTRMYD